MATVKNAFLRDLNAEMGISETAVKHILTLVKDLKFGEVIIKVQDGRIVSLEKHEKIRIEKSADPQDERGKC